MASPQKNVCAPPAGRASDPPSPPARFRHPVVRSFTVASRAVRVFALIAATAALSLHASEAPALPVRYWDLPTGSHLAYIHVPAPDPTQARTLVFVHGGPGACQVYSYAFAQPWYERLARLGFDVYLYDQIGGGYSARLPNPRNYTIERHLADLEAIRHHIGAGQLVLIGESHGATLSAAYLAAHPTRVERIVFLAPGALDPFAWKDRIYPYATPRVAREMSQWIAATRGPAAAQRCAQLDALLQHDVDAAYAFASDAEMDPLMDAFVNETILATCVHDHARLAERQFSIHGMGWWASVMTTWSNVSVRRSVRARLASSDIPALILRGDSDYLPPEIADEYAATFRRAQLIHVPAAGHFIWMDQPERFRDAIVAFLSADAPASTAISAP